MTFRRLFVLVEGLDDELFFERIVKPLILKDYSVIKIWQYAVRKKKTIRKYINSLNRNIDDYLFFGDLNNAPCVTKRKEKWTERYSWLDRSKSYVIVKEIESWYLAGVTADFSKPFKIPDYKTTDNITKQQFNAIIPKRLYDSRINFMQDILKIFSVEEATVKNRSFEYFMRKVVGK